ncbi:hypothetical protein RHGRI_030018 [Rhododendron griersonianum]|uniref:DNA topoisomerase (ATP-hydrolyzing) n=1 Tax=Rhododendron griersonianum TaxID=479676 RepID=A0AAV6IRU7_9ERIC|nr:hypothetical protein RHGRI_030018 [Rhododendron griersonianum]
MELDLGEFGYIAPEYSSTMVASLKGDVYGFGVVLLDLATGLKPLDVSNADEGFKAIPFDIPNNSNASSTEGDGAVEISGARVDWLKGKIDNSSLFARDGDYDLASVGQYFNDLESHNKDIIWEDEQDGEAIELAFSKKKFEARKNWLRHFEPGTYLNQKEKLIKYNDFVYKELILFSMADLQRSIPSITSADYGPLIKRQKKVNNLMAKARNRAPMPKIDEVQARKSGETLSREEEKKQQRWRWSTEVKGRRERKEGGRESADQDRGMCK